LSYHDREILLVEDNPDDEALTRRAFARNKIKNPIISVSDGAAALDYLFGEGAYVDRKDAPLPHVVLLDMNLPKIPGIEVLRRIRSDARTWYLPVVILTSSRERQDLIDSHRSGVNFYVRKPVDFEEFVRTAGQLGFYWLHLNETIESP
jgi:two-component system response regulator